MNVFRILNVLQILNVNHRKVTKVRSGLTQVAGINRY